MRFPVLCIPRDLGLYAVASPEMLGRCRASLFWRADVYHGLRIVDSDGCAFAVAEARVSRPASRLLQALTRILDTAVQVELRVEPTTPPSLAELKALVQTAIDDDPETFEELSGKSVAWWRATVARATSPQEILHAFTGSSADG